MPPFVTLAWMRRVTYPRRAERRTCPRQPSSLRGSCHTVRGKDHCTARIRDVSAGSVDLVLRRRFKPGTALAIEPLGAGASAPPYLLVQVIHATPRPNDHWLLGRKFVTPLSEDQVQALLQARPRRPRPRAELPARARSAPARAMG